jgi:asparagine synthase (glutamine-hydrolysing)
MDRFVAMIWDQEDPTRQLQVNSWSEALQRQSSKWRRVLDAPGLRVLSYHHRGEGPVVTEWAAETGVVVGVLFERGQETRGRVRSMDQRTAKRVVDSRGDELIKNYWGNYLALWRNPETREAIVLRDPCGAVPCFMTRQQGVELLYAHMEDVADLPGLSFTVDWEYLKAFQLFNYFITEHTGLNEVKELLGGERSEYRGSAERRRSWAWNGAEIAANPRLKSFEDAKAELRETVMTCFTAWGREYQNIVIQMSGGLDSSILASIMRRVSSARITGAHYVSIGREQREVEKARLAAAHAGVELVELPLNPETEDILRMFEIPRLARPTRQIRGLNTTDLLAAFASRVGADCCMAGHGGDNLLVHGRPARYSLADYVMLNGVGRQFWPLVYDTATLRMCSVSHILGDTLKALLRRESWRPYAFFDDESINRYRLLTAETIATISKEYMEHPWIAQASRLPRAKADHLMNMVALDLYYGVCGDSVQRDYLNPYFSQPVAEFALETPTYLFNQDGLSRSLERRTFADLIPNEITRRIIKGAYAIGSLKANERHMTFLRGLVLEGELAKHGWFDRTKMEKMLTGEHMVHGGGVSFVNSIVIAEAWLNSWRSDDARAAA